MSSLKFPFALSPEDYLADKCLFLKRLINCVTIEPSLKTTLLLISVKSQNILLSTILDDLGNTRESVYDEDCNTSLYYLILILFNSLAKLLAPVPEANALFTERELQNIETINRLINQVFSKLRVITRFKNHSVILIEKFDPKNLNYTSQQTILRNLSLNFKLITLSPCIVVLDEKGPNLSSNLDIQFIEALSSFISTNNHQLFVQDNKELQNFRTRELFSICLVDALNIITNLKVESEFILESIRNVNNQSLKWITDLNFLLYKFIIQQSYILLDFILALSSKGKNINNRPTICDALEQTTQNKPIQDLSPSEVITLNDMITQKTLEEYDIYKNFFLPSSINDAIDSFVEIGSIIPAYFPGLLYSITNLSNIMRLNKFQNDLFLPKSVIFLIFIISNSCSDFHIRLSSINATLIRKDPSNSDTTYSMAAEKRIDELLICKTIRFLIPLIKAHGLNVADLKNRLGWQSMLFTNESSSQELSSDDIESPLQESILDNKNIGPFLHTDSVNIKDDNDFIYKKIIIRNERMYPVFLLMDVMNRCAIKQPLIDGLSAIYNASVTYNGNSGADNNVNLETNDCLYFMLYDYGIIDMVFGELFACVNSLIRTFLESPNLPDSINAGIQNIFLSNIENFKTILPDIDSVSIFKVASADDLENLYFCFRILNFFIESPSSISKKSTYFSKKLKKKTNPNKVGISTTSDSFNFDETIEDSTSKDGSNRNYESGSRGSLKFSIRNDILMRLLGLCYMDSKSLYRGSALRREQPFTTSQYYSSLSMRRHSLYSSTVPLLLTRSNTSYEPRNVYKRGLKAKSSLGFEYKEKQGDQNMDRFENLFNILIINTLILFSFLSSKLMSRVNDQPSTTKEVFSKVMKYSHHHFSEFQIVYKLLRELLWMLKKISKEASLYRSELLHCLKLTVIVELLYNCTSDFEQLWDKQNKFKCDSTSGSVGRIVNMMNKVTSEQERDRKGTQDKEKSGAVFEFNIPVLFSKIKTIKTFKKFTTIIHYIMDIRINTCLVLANLNLPMSPIKATIQKSLLANDDDTKDSSKTFRDFITRNFKFDAMNGSVSDEESANYLSSNKRSPQDKLHHFGIFNYWTSGDLKENRITQNYNAEEFVESYLVKFCDMSNIFRYISREDDAYDDELYQNSLQYCDSERPDRLRIKYPCLVSLSDIFYLKVSNLITFQNSLYQTTMFFDPKNFLQNFCIDDLFKLLIHDDSNKQILNFISANYGNRDVDQMNLKAADMFNCMVLEYKNHILCVLRNLLIHKNSINRCVEFLKKGEIMEGNGVQQQQIKNRLKKAIVENLNVYNIAKCPEIVLTMLAIAVNLITVNGDDSRNMICWDEEPSSERSVSEPGVLFKRINDIFQLKLPIVDSGENFGNGDNTASGREEPRSTNDSGYEYRELNIFLKKKYSSRDFEQVSSVVIREMIHEDCNNLALTETNKENLNKYLTRCYVDLSNDHTMTHYYTNIKIACAWIMLNLLWSSRSETEEANNSGTATVADVSEGRSKRHSIIQRHTLMFTNGVFECAKRYSNSSDINLRERASTVTNLLSVLSSEIRSMIRNLPHKSS